MFEMATFREIDNSATDKTIYSKDLPTLLEYRQELNRVETSNVGDRLFQTRWGTLHRIVCDLIQKIEIQESEKRTLEVQEKFRRELAADADKKHKEQIGESRYANRLSVVAIGVAVVATAIAILGWRFPRETHELNQTEAHQALAPSTTNTIHTILTLVTNATPTNQSTPIQESVSNLDKAQPGMP
ncbi:MAG: hypothetical protein WDM76_03160 [Limisphaerales bacterium]